MQNSGHYPVTCIFPKRFFFTEAASHAPDRDSRQEIYCITSAAPRLLVLYRASFLRPYFRCEIFLFLCRVSFIRIRLGSKKFQSVLWSWLWFRVPKGNDKKEHKDRKRDTLEILPFLLLLVLPNEWIMLLWNKKKKNVYSDISVTIRRK